MFRRVHLRPYSLCARFGRSRTSRPLLFLIRNILSIRKSRTLGSSPPQSASSNCFPATSWKRSSSLPPSLSNSQRSLTFLLPARPRLLSGLCAASRHRTSHCHPERGRAILMPARVEEPCVSACGAGALARVPARAFQTLGLSPPRNLAPYPPNFPRSIFPPPFSPVTDTQLTVTITPSHLITLPDTASHGSLHCTFWMQRLGTYTLLTWPHPAIASAVINAPTFALL